MSSHTPLLSFSCFCLLAACTTGDDGNTDTHASHTTSESSTESETDTESETTGTPLACGEIECGPDEACLTFPQQPNCQDLMEGEMCPEGTTETQCGGAGLPCCCEPTPPPIYMCTPTDACGDSIDCTCLADVCTPMCTATADALVFVCDAPPPP